MSKYSSKFELLNILKLGRKKSDDRLLSVLHNCQTNVMVADADYNIIYMNETMTQMMRGNEAELKKELPNFNAHTLIGSNIDIFHKNPAHQRGMLAGLRAAHRTSITVGDLAFTLIATPLFDADGNRTGTSVEWEDVTDKLKAEREAAAIASENARIREALDGAKTNVMLADQDYNIIYMNKTMVEMMTNAQQDIRTELPNFDVNKLLGANIDVFHKNPAHQRRMLDALTETYEGSIELGGRTFNLIANPVLDDDGQRIGTSVEWADVTDKLREERERAERAAANARIKVGLDKCTTNVMLADMNGDIIYMNESVNEMLQVAEKDLQKSLPNFRASEVLGSNMDIFHKNPAHQKELLARLASTYQTEITVGARKFSLIANPVNDEDGNRLGTVVEWKDVTDERNAEAEIARVVEAISVGDFTSRIDEEGKQGFMLNIAKGVNEIASICDKGLTEVGQMLRYLADGDLTKRIETDYQGTFDALKQDSNGMAEKLAEIVASIAESADEVSSAASQIAEGSADLSERTESQASALEETAAAMEQIAATVKNNSENAQEASQLSQEARDVATKGGEVVSDAVTAMDRIEQSSQKISDIIGVIDEIAFQTNLLALNAAVEAARAGDAGKGFAVVASEVRKLAQRSSEAAKDIKNLIVDSGNQVKDGVRLVGEAGTTLNDILKSIKNVTDIVSEIAAASEEQSTGIEEINKSVTEMDDMTQQNSALVEESTAAARSMEEQAHNMTSRMEFFNIGEAYVRAAPAAGPKAAEEKPAKAAPKKVVKKAASKKVDIVDDEDWSEF